MSRSASKFIFITEYDLATYLKTQIQPFYSVQFQPNIRQKTFNKWNYKSYYYIPQGKYTVKVRPTLYHLAYKVGSFAKTRKPFFFRSKKKKS